MLIPKKTISRADKQRSGLHNGFSAPVADQRDMGGRLVLKAVRGDAVGFPIGWMSRTTMRVATSSVFDVFMAMQLVLIAPERNTSDGITKVGLFRTALSTTFFA
jgi:hypothetical protein